MIITNEKDEERFLLNIDIKEEDMCWLWKGGISKNNGYGRMKINGEMYRAHRISWEYFNEKEIPENMLICHKCDVKLCCNPFHLFLGTHQDNMHDKFIKGRNCYGEKSGRYTHPETTARGERVGTSKLNENQVIEIIQLLKSKDIKQTEIAKKFNVNKSLITKIKLGEVWVHLTNGRMN